MGIGQLSAVLGSLGAQVTEPGDLEERLRERVRAGQAAWPGLALHDEAFISYLADRVQRGALPPFDHAADLWLACACALGIPGAAGQLSRVYGHVIEHAASRIARWDAEDAKQHVLSALLVGGASCPPRIGEYGGRAALRSWLRTVATRTALNRQRRMDARAHESVSGLVDIAAHGDVDLQLLRARCRPALEQALRLALGGLSPRHRVLLRLHELDHWSIDKIGASYRVGRSTAARWVSAARQALLEATRGRLRESLKVTPSELDSVLRDLHSDILSLSLVRLLAQAEEEAGAIPQTE